MLLNVRDLAKAEAAFLLELIYDATQCADSDQFVDLFSTLKTLLPFEFATAFICMNHGSADPESGIMFNISYPDEFLKEYVSRGYENIDPVVKDNLSSGGLHYWADSFERYGCPRELPDLSSDFGLKNACKGYGYGYGLTNGRATEKGLISFYGLQRAERTETILSLVVPILQEAMKCVRKRAPAGHRLTPREKEILQWCAAGKNCWDVSRILKISERTVKFHTDNVMKKLDAVNRTHAVAIALREQIIALD